MAPQASALPGLPFLSSWRTSVWPTIEPSPSSWRPSALPASRLSAPLAAVNGMSPVAIGLPALVAFGPQSVPSCTTRWYLPALMPSNQPVEATATGEPSSCENVTVAPLIFTPLTGVRSALACHDLGGGGGGGSAGSAGS